MTLFANNTVTGEYNNGGAIFAKENSTLNLTDVIFSGNVAGGYGGAIYLLVLTILVPSIYVSLTPCFAITSLMMAKVAQFTINNDVYLSDVIFDKTGAYTSTSYSDGDGGRSMLPIIIATASILQVIR
ncbi:hypothetical protein ACLK17_13815 [Escherichia coli]